MALILINTRNKAGQIKPMNAVNNGPIKARGDQSRGNFEQYRAARIPFARTHDAAFCEAYGGAHTVDISAIFPDFNADPYDERSYDFPVTDHYLHTIEEAGTEVFFRLGHRIEHGVKKYGTLPPPDFQKWAVICEHIIRHYTEGWAGGTPMKIRYWEIWNEPDLDPDDSPNKRCWGGTRLQFYDLYKTAAKHLKACFPHLMIGGPALAGSAIKNGWLDGFLQMLQKEQAPLDFLSWHCYATDPRKLLDRAALVRSMLDKAGFSGTESHCNEWNYVINWSDRFVESVEDIISMRGAAFTAAVIAGAQAEGNLDMLMYYDARPTPFNGLFDYYTYRPLKGYYPFPAFSALAEIGTAAETVIDGADLYAAAASDGERLAVIAAYYSPDKEMYAPQEVELRWDLPGKRTVLLLDETHDLQEICKVEGGVTLTLKPDSMVLIQ